VVVQLSNADGQLHLSVVDNGRGVESGFRLEDATGLGLSIVRTLVTTELDGRISMRPLTADEAALLDQQPGRPALRVERIAFDPAQPMIGQPIRLRRA
jgi:hypothetical protein